MLNAKDAAAKTAMGQTHLKHGHELKIIEDRISGAAAAGKSTVEVVFEGNVFDEETIETVKQVLLEQGYKVKTSSYKKLGNQAGWQFNISW